jgi:hypothetical protein
MGKEQRLSPATREELGIRYLEELLCSPKSHRRQPFGNFGRRPRPAALATDEAVGNHTQYNEDREERGNHG